MQAPLMGPFSNLNHLLNACDHSWAAENLQKKHETNRPRVELCRRSRAHAQYIDAVITAQNLRMQNNANKALRPSPHHTASKLGNAHSKSICTCPPQSTWTSLHN